MPRKSSVTDETAKEGVEMFICLTLKLYLSHDLCRQKQEAAAVPRLFRIQGRKRGPYCLFCRKQSQKKSKLKDSD